MDDRPWKLQVTMNASSYKALIKAAREWSRLSESVKSFNDFAALNLGVNDGDRWGFHTECTTPINVRIKALREEADRLETELASPPSTRI